MEEVNCLCPYCETSIKCTVRPVDSDLPFSVVCQNCGCKLITHNPVELPNSTAEQEENFYPRPFVEKGWQCLGVIGRGGMGIVYAVRRETDQTLRAVKVLPPECSKYPELIDRFLLEARSMAYMTHPNIISIHDIGQAQGLIYFVMNYISGVNLKEAINHREKMSVEEAIVIGSGIAEALQFCHDQGLVHRDLKTANIMLGQQGQVTVMDFGIANLLCALGEKTDAGVAIGTPQYISPEQREDGSSVDHRADQFSLATILYELLTGNLPMGVFEMPHEVNTNLSVKASEAIMKALSRNREKRFPTIRGFMRAVRSGQGYKLSSHNARTLIRRIAMEEHCPNVKQQNSKDDTPLSKSRESHFSLEHPARVIDDEELTTKEEIEDLLPNDNPSTPKPQPYKEEQTPLAPWWRRKKSEL